jgi:hypothetical protein
MLPPPMNAIVELIDPPCEKLEKVYHSMALA